MSKPPAFQFYAKDWLASATVACMSLHDRGIYIQLLAAAWDSEEPGTLPLPLSIVAKSSHVSITNVRRFCNKWNQCFVQMDGKLVNLKLLEQWRELQEFSEKKRDAANKRWHKEKSRADAPAMQVQCPASASAFAFASEVKDVEPKPKEREEKPNYVPAALVVPVDLWLSFVEMRKKIRKPLTGRAAEMIAAKLRWFGEHGGDPSEILSQSIMNSWAGVFPVKENSNGRTESFEERRQRKSAEAVGEVRTRVDEVVRKMDDSPRLTSGQQSANSGLRRGPN